jgi:hypothetical protein
MGMITVLLVRFSQEKVLILIVVMFLNAKARSRTMKQVDSKTNRMVMIGLYSKGTDGQMYTSSFILCEILILHTLEEENIMHIYIKDKKLIKEQAKVCMTAKRKNNLLSCNMDTYNTRKVLCEKVQVYATLIGCNL